MSSVEAADRQVIPMDQGLCHCEDVSLWLLGDCCHCAFNLDASNLMCGEWRCVQQM